MSKLMSPEKGCLGAQGEVGTDMGWGVSSPRDLDSADWAGVSQGCQRCLGAGASQGRPSACVGTGYTGTGAVPE